MTPTPEPQEPEITDPTATPDKIQQLLAAQKLATPTVARPTPIPMPADSLTVTSPDGKIEVTFGLIEGVPHYRVTRTGMNVILPSKLGFTFLTDAPLNAGFEILDWEKNSHDEVWTQPWGEVKEIVGRLWKWALAGIALGALFHGYAPEAWVTEHLGGKDNWLAVPGAVLLGVPLYSNATGVIPVAEAMLGKGVAIGTTLAFMMSIAALSLPEMIILRKVIKWPALALYASVLAIAFMLVGWGFNLLTA